MPGAAVPGAAVPAVRSRQRLGAGDEAKAERGPTRKLLPAARVERVGASISKMKEPLKRIESALKALAVTWLQKLRCLLEGRNGRVREGHGASPGEHGVPEISISKLPQGLFSPRLAAPDFHPRIPEPQTLERLWLGWWQIPPPPGCLDRCLAESAPLRPSVLPVRLSCPSVCPARPPARQQLSRGLVALHSEQAGSPQPRPRDLPRGFCRAGAAGGRAVAQSPGRLQPAELLGSGKKGLLVKNC